MAHTGVLIGDKVHRLKVGSANIKGNHLVGFNFIRYLVVENNRDARGMYFFKMINGFGFLPKWYQQTLYRSPCKVLQVLFLPLKRLQALGSDDMVIFLMGNRFHPAEYITEKIIWDDTYNNADTSPIFMA